MALTQLSAIKWLLTADDNITWSCELPYIMGIDPAIAKKINDYVFIDVMHQLAPKELSTVEQAALIEEFEGSPIASSFGMDMIFHFANERWLSFQLLPKNCSLSTGGGFDEIYNFDLTSGRHILVQDLLTDAGIKQMNQQLCASRIARIEQEIALLTSKLISASSDLTAAIAEKIKLYESFIGNVQEQQDYDRDIAFRLDELMYFSINANAITFYHASEAGFNMRDIDDIGVFKNTFSFDALMPYITPYARELFCEQAAEASGTPMLLNGQVYYGTLGDQKITMKLAKEEDEAYLINGGLYFLEGQAKPIKLSRTFESSLALKENKYGHLNKYEFAALKHKEIEADIIAKQDGDCLVGEWQGSHKLPLILNLKP